MTAAIDQERDHYRRTGLTERLRTVLATIAPEDQRIPPERLSALDQFHTRGLAATSELAELAGITAESSVLDVGAGLGGPARFLAASRGCQVTGVDLSEPFVDAARYLTERTGLSDRVTFRTASALELPFAAGAFEVVLLQHVAMNIADRARLYREIRRVLAEGGRFATYDMVLRDGEPIYPLPWARSASTSFLLAAEATRAAIEAAGFSVRIWRDDTDAAKAWFGQQRAAGAPPPLNLGLVMGAEFAGFAANLGRCLVEGRLGVLTAVFAAVAVNS